MTSKTISTKVCDFMPGEEVVVEATFSLCIQASCYLQRLPASRSQSQKPLVTEQRCPGMHFFFRCFYRTTLCQSEVLRCHPDKGRLHTLFCLAGNTWKWTCADVLFRTVALATFLCRFAVLLLARESEPQNAILHLGTCDPSIRRSRSLLFPSCRCFDFKASWCDLVAHSMTCYNGMVRNVWICRQAEGSFDLGCQAFGHEKLGGNPVSKIFQSKHGKKLKELRKNNDSKTDTRDAKYAGIIEIN